MYHTDSEYLKTALDCGMIDMATLQAQIDMAEKLKYLEGYHIWQGENGYWYTKLRKDGRKVLLRHKSKEAIEKDIVAFERAKEDRPTVAQVFYMFVDQKLRYKDISKSTYDRYVRDYERYIKGNPIENMEFQKLNEEYLTDYIRKVIADNDLTAKAYSNLKTIWRGMLLFAKGKYTSISPQAFFGDMEFSKNTFRKKVVCKENEVFLEDEIPMVLSYLRERKNLRQLGILLAFQTGMRVGELAAIKKTDIITEADHMYIHVQRTETKFREDGKYVTQVKEYPKSSAGDRYVVCTDNARETIREILAINKDGEYLFEENGKRICESSFANAITWMCKSLHIPNRSMHKIRKTYGTSLIDAGVDESVIIEQMGHSDIHCTKQYYYFSNKNRDKKRDQIQKAINF